MTTQFQQYIFGYFLELLISIFKTIYFLLKKNKERKKVRKKVFFFQMIEINNKQTMYCNLQYLFQQERKHPQLERYPQALHNIFQFRQRLLIQLLTSQIYLTLRQCFWKSCNKQICKQSNKQIELEIYFLPLINFLILQIYCVQTQILQSSNFFFYTFYQRLVCVQKQIRQQMYAINQQSLKRSKYVLHFFMR
ncbi:hypothetical protein ABPG74_017220 [Tetrahymena malaccensis]